MIRERKIEYKQQKANEEKKVEALAEDDDFIPSIKIRLIKIKSVLLVLSIGYQ